MHQVKRQNMLEAHDQAFEVIDERYCRIYDLPLKRVLGRRCHEVSHHSDRPCHENGEDCPHLALFRDAQGSEVLHTHYHGDGTPHRTRIRGHALRGPNGRLYLGEVLYPLEVDVELGCEDLRMVGHSPAFLACVDRLARVAECEAPVLLLGESGVGKELAARYVHDRSPRAGKPFVAINCAAVPESLFETELFGHEKGAFSGCAGQKPGLCQQADGGTLFLDEVAEIPYALQAKLLRVLETGEFRRVGGTRAIKADLRLISASNRDLMQLVDKKRFRQDLYYRLAGIEVALPPLRERREDIPALARVLLERMARPGRPPCQLDRDAVARLKRYDFPGNVRELRNLLQRAAVQCQGGVIRAADLGLDGPAGQRPTPARPIAAAPVEAPKRLTDVEREHIRGLLERHGGHRRTVAALLGVTERTLYRKLKQYGLN